MSELALNQARVAVIAGLSDIVETLPSPLDEEDAEQLVSALTGNIRGTRLITLQGSANLRYAAAFICPIYSSESLAKFSRFMESLDPAGVRLLSGALVTDGGAVITRIHPRSQDIVVDPSSAPSNIWQTWLKRGGMKGALALSGNDSLDRVLASSLKAEAAELCAAWFKAAEPAFQFGMRGCSGNDFKRNLRHVRASLDAAMSSFFQEAQNIAQSDLREHIDSRARELTEKSVLPTVGMYNFLTAPPAEGADPAYVARNREQALQFWPNLSGVLSSFSVDGGFPDKVRAWIDRGEKPLEAMRTYFDTEGSVIKAFLNAKLPLAGGKAREIDAFWIRDFVQTLRQIPAGRFPKEEVEITIAKEMRSAGPSIERLAVYTMQRPAELWEGALKAGWAAAATHFAANQAGEATTDPAELGHRAAIAISETVAVADYLLELAESCQAQSRTGLPHQATPDEVTQVLLRGKTLKKVAEYLPELTQVIVNSEAAAMQAGAQILYDAEWSPMLSESLEVKYENCTVTELVNEHQLLQEGAAMGHCVGGYSSGCMRHGQRIFRFVAGEGSPKNREERGTLCLVINQTGDGFSENQFRAYQNGPVGDNLRAAADLLKNQLQQGIIPSDLDGFRKDRLRGYQKLSVEKKAEAQRMKVMDEGAAFLMPKTGRGMSLTQFMSTPAFSEELGVVRKVNAPKERLEPGMAPT